MQKEMNGFNGFDSFISSFRIGEPDAHKNLNVYPVYSPQVINNGYMLLQDAIKTEKFSVTEVDDSGNVPNLKVINGLEEDVLILDGEALVGAKQNRIVNTTIIIGRMQETIIPVSCVEQGRWRHTRKDFRSSKFNLYSDLRRKKAKSVTRNLKASASYMSDQGEIWNDISQKQVRFSVKSDTGDMHDIYENYEKDLKKYEEAFKPKSDQVGFVAMIDNKIIGCDIFGTGKVLPKVYKNLLSGYILDALDKNLMKTETPSEMGDNSKDIARAFIEGLKSIKKESFKSVGMGDDLRLESDAVNGFALVHHDKIVHLAAFAG